jgi:hypothetical protein
VATRSAKLLSRVSNVANFTDAFYCPSTAFVIVKSWHVQNFAAETNAMTIFVADPIRGTQIYLFSDQLTPQAEAAGEVWIVLEPEDAVAVSASVIGGHFWISGAKLPLPS